jgi:hypothetical protein
MSGENSCFSRFLVKFIEVSAAGLATANQCNCEARGQGVLGRAQMDLATVLLNNASAQRTLLDAIPLARRSVTK